MSEKKSEFYEYVQSGEWRRLDMQGFTTENTAVLVRNDPDHPMHEYCIYDVISKEILQRISFQTGPTSEAGVNGIYAPDLIQVLIAYLSSFQGTDTRCKENDKALKALYKAVLWLRRRTERRRADGVLGTSIGK